MFEWLVKLFFGKQEIEDNKYKRWTEEEEYIVLTSEAPDYVIATQLGRTTSAVRNKRKRLELASEEDI